MQIRLSRPDRGLRLRPRPSPHRLPAYLALTLLLATFGSTSLWAQSQATTGVIEGTVVDANADALPGATVTLRNTATNFELALISDSRGRFRGLLLPLGPYEATARLNGFATLVRDGIVLSVGQTLSLRLEMQLSAVEQEIQVTAGAALVETSRTQNSTLIDRETLEGVPNNGRNFLEFSLLTPGAAIVQGPDGDELSINGQKGIQNNISVDGADFNNPFFGEQRGGQRPAFFFNLDAIQELVVVPDGAPAEFGRSSSGFVNVVTKSGTNATHGTVNLFFKNDALATEVIRRDGSREPKPDSFQTQVGFTLGGPVRQDRLFYFTALDLQVGESTKQNDPLRIERRVVDAFASLGSPAENAPIERSDDALAWLGKLDWLLTDEHLFTGRLNLTDAQQDNGTFDVDSWGASANAVEEDSSGAVSASLVSTLSNNLLNEARTQWAREERPRPYTGPTLAETDRPLPDTAFDFARGYRFGMPFFIPVEYYDTRLQLNNNTSWISGQHTIKAGLEFNQTSAVQTFIGFANGRYIFSSTDGFLSYVDNPSYVECSDGSSSPSGACPAGTTVTGPVLFYLQQAGVGGLSVNEAGTQDITQDEPALFIQDTWQPLENLTVQYGLRWEAQIQPDPITPPEEVFFSDLIGQTRLGQRFPSDGTIPSDRDMWQPRLAVAWDPSRTGKTVVRASAGLYYARVPGLVLASTRSTNGSRGQSIFRSSELQGILGPVPAYPNLIPQDQIGDPFLPDVFVFDENFENPRTEAISVALERELAARTSLLVKFNYAKTEQLTRFVNRNDPLLGSPWSSGLGDAGINGINTLTTVESTASSLYQGYTLSLNHQTSRLRLQANYTYSKDRSDDDNERDPFTFRYAKVTDLEAERGFSDRDQRDRINAWLVWQAPQKISVNARFGYNSPQPKSLTADGLDASTPQDRCVPRPAAGGCSPDATVVQRNLGRKDNKFSTLDVRISRPFRVGAIEVIAIAEVFNLFNSKNLRVPEATNLIFNFDGTVTSGLGDPRQLQLGVRLAW